MKQILFFGISITVAFTGVEAQVQTPSYETVAQRFCDVYDYPEEKYLRLGKMPDGWHVTEIQNGEGGLKTVKDQLFWQRSDNRWLPLAYFPLAHLKPLDENVGYDALLRQKSYQYDVLPYYGYKGWYTDVIDEYGNRAELTDTLLYALMKAYYEKCSALLGNQYGYGSDNDRLGKFFPPNALSEVDVTVYKSWATKELETCRRLQKQNPEFKPFIGNMNQQLGNEYMSHWLNLYMWQNEAAARSFLQPDLYDAFTLDMAHNFLASCPPNAILFSNGDNDTYPLLYLQKQLGFRTDVTLLNMSLLAFPPYVLMLAGQYGLFTKSIADEKIKDPEYGYVVLGNDKPIYGAQLSKKLEKKESYGYLPSKQIKLKAKPDMEFWLNQEYIYLDELVLLDIIAQNMGKRPICFVQTSFPNQAFHAYLYNQGLLYILQPKRHEVIGLAAPATDLKKEARLFLGFKLGPYTANEASGRSSEGFIANYRAAYALLAGNLLASGEREIALQLMDKIDSAFPVDQFPVTLVGLYMIDTYIALEKKEKARQYIEATEQEIQKETDEAKKNRYELFFKELKDKLER